MRLLKVMRFGLLMLALFMVVNAAAKLEQAES